MKLNKSNFIKLNNSLSDEKITEITKRAERMRKVNLGFYSAMSAVSIFMTVKSYRNMASGIIENPAKFAELVKTGDFRSQLIGLILIVIVGLIAAIVAIETYVSSPADELTVAEINMINKHAVDKMKETGTSYIVGKKNRLGYRVIKQIEIRA